MNEAGQGYEPEFLRGGGELGSLLRAYDWASTPLGPPCQWPQSLKTAIRIMITSRQPIWIGWGPELIYFYNDAYKSIIGGKHPWALGRPTAEVWEEIWDDIGPMLATAMTGEEGTFVEEQLLIMERSGYPEETYYTFSYSPIPADDGSAGGIICANTEDTGRVIGERQLALLRELGAETADARTWDDTRRSVERALATNPHDITFALVYMAPESGEGFELAAEAHLGREHPAAPATLSEEDRPWPIGEALREHKPVVIHDVAARFDGPLAGGAWSEPTRAAAILPIAASGDTGRPGILIVGLNPYRLFDEGYEGFLKLAAGQIGAAFASAEAYEEERRRAEQLAELDRAKTAFFSNISHEFRTPLTLMLGPLEEVLAKPEGALPGEERHLVDVAHRNGLRLMKLVNALLEFSRIEAGRIQARYEATDIAAYTADLASSFRSATEKAGLDLIVETRPLSAPAYVDRDMWEKIVLNLLSNAFKFTLEGEIRVELDERDGKAVLSIADTGIGIAASDLPRMFERFHRVEGAKGRSFEGSGIGLALVQELARLHGGEVSVESELGKGSRFSVSFPLGDDHLPAEHVVAGHSEPVAARADTFVEEALRWLPNEPASDHALRSESNGEAAPPARILLADDNADMRDYVRRLLAGQYEVEAVADGQQAIEAIARRVPDLVLTDVMMPRVDGFELLRTIRGDERLRNLPVVMLSARAGQEAQVEGIEAGADDYLVKPFSARDLVARVSTNLALAKARKAAESALRTLNDQLSAETARLSSLFAEAPPIMAVLRGPDHVFELANPAYRRLVGERALIGRPVAEALPEVAEQGFVTILDNVRATGKAYVGKGVPVRLARGTQGEFEERSVDFVFQPLPDGEGRASGIFIAGTDVTERVRAENQGLAQNRILEAAVAEGTLQEALETLVRVVEDISPSGMLGSVQLLDEDGMHLRHGAAPSLPASYNAAVDGLAIGPGVGSCGTAAHSKQPVLVADIASDHLWADFKDVALQHGLHACWSTPIISAHDKVLGTFAFYYGAPRAPDPSDIELVNFVARSAALLIERKRAEEALKEQAHTLRRLNETGSAMASELDLERVVQIVTDAGVELTGAGVGAFFHNVPDDDGDKFTLYTVSGAEPAAFSSFPTPRRTALLDHTFSGLGVLRSPDIAADARYGRNGPHFGLPPGHPQVRSYLAVPVTSRNGEVLGGLFFGHPEPGRFREQHEQLIVGIAGQAAIAIDNARLFDSAQREIEERRRAETAVRELNQSLEARIAQAIAEREAVEEVLRQAQKMEAVGQLTGGVAHDFNNLLTIITGNMDMALRTIEAGGDAARAKRAIGNAIKGAERAAALTQRLLAFSRRQPLAPKPLNADKLITGMSEMLRRALGELIQLETSTAAGLWRVEVDPNQLESAILNLAVNARDAMPSGGKLTIETANVHLDEAYTAGQAEVAPGSYVVIAVSDTGAGMSRTTLGRAFEPFFTTKEVGKGTGLGLSMVYGFVKQSGGHVKIYSEEGEGTTVKIYLPRLISEETEEENHDLSLAAPGTLDETLLVVEDDDDVRAYTVEILRELGYRVLEAHDGPAALALIERADVTIDLLFTDVVMPAMSGRELTDAARQIRPHLKVLYTSGYTRNAIVHGGRLDPGVQMLAKPFTFEALSTKVREVLDSGTSGRVLAVGAPSDVAAEALTGAGYGIDTAQTAAEALGKVRAARGRYDAVVIGDDLPGRGGIALLRELRAQYADLPLLLISGEGEPAVPRDHRTSAIARPFASEDLRRTLDSIGLAARTRS